MGSLGHLSFKLLILALPVLVTCAACGSATTPPPADPAANLPSGANPSAPEGNEAVGLDPNDPNDPNDPAEETPVTPLWPKQIGTPERDRGQALLVDDERNLYVAGWTNGVLDPSGAAAGAALGANFDTVLIKYDSAGNELWRKQFGGAGDDIPAALAQDDQGDLYVTGYTTADLEGNAFGGGRSDLFLRKFTPSGDFVWTTLVGTLASEEPAAMAHFKESLYVVGRGSRDIAVWRFNQTDGTHTPAIDLLETTGSASFDHAADIAADADGNIYVAGYTLGAFPWFIGGRDQDPNGQARTFFNASGPDAFLMRLDFDLFIQDTITIPSGRDVTASSVDVDDSGNIYVAGLTTTLNLDDPFELAPPPIPQSFVAKFNPRFARLWVRESGQTTLEADVAIDVAPNGEAVVAATEGEAVATARIAVSKISAAGDLVYARLFGSDQYEEARDVAADVAGNVYVTGLTQGILAETGREPGALDDDLFVLGLDVNGDPL